MNRSTIAVAALAGLLALPLAAPKPAAAQESATMATTTLKVGDVAPNFTLPSDQGKPVTLADYHGKKNVMLAFYVLAFTGG
jgi:cytochrome oxidase Cu insertion factor (SCO1/SenC/PrrC family)